MGSMGELYHSDEEKDWQDKGLMDFESYSDCIRRYNQVENEYGEYSGEWFYGDDETLTVYFGGFGIYNSLGDRDFISAEVFEDEQTYRAMLKVWESYPEYLNK